MTYLAKNILVTGGAGFIGAHFIHCALQHDPNFYIINLDKLTYAGSLERLQNLSDPKRHQFIHGDINDYHLVKNLLETYQIDSIIHFAAESHVDHSIAQPDTFMQTNVIGTFTLLEAAKNHWLNTQKWQKKACRFFHISTDEVYGSLSSNDATFTEQTAFNPRSPYSASKASSDHLVNAYYHTYDLPILISHCSNNYGPNQHQEKFIPTVITACLEQRPIPIYGHGNNIRDWIYVSDHCQGILNILQHGTLGETYNLGGNNEWKNIHLAKKICSLMDDLIPQHAPHHQLLTFVDDRPGHDFRYAINTQKINTHLNWQPKETLESGLQKTIAFYLTKHQNP